MLEGVEAGEGKGYSKKESQQLASKETLQKLRREPQFIEKVFDAKANRTKMEEEPVQSVPDLDAASNFIRERGEEKGEKRKTSPKAKQEEKPIEVFSENPKRAKRMEEKPIPAPKKPEAEDDEFDLSDITANPKEEDKEDIIAKAEAMAFSEGAE